MRIVLLSQWYLPEPDIKVHLLAKDLIARGHQVISVTGFPNYPQGRIYSGYRQRLWQWEEMDGVRVLRLPLYPDHSRSRVKRILNYLSFAVSASILAPILSGPIDVMWVYHPPLTVGIPAWWLNLLRRTPFIYEVQDMWPETIAATGMLSDNIALHWLTRLARFIYKRATAITVISPGFKQNLIQKGVPADKIYVISNWANEEIYRPLSPDSTLADKYGLTDKFNIIYGGNLGAAQAMDNVLQAASLLRDLSAIQFVLIGDGVDEVALKQQAKDMGLNNVRFIERQTVGQMPHFFALADVLLVHLRRDPLFEITIPGKTIAYLGCGKPILGAVSGDAADLIRQAGAGIICQQEDPASLAQTVRDLYAMSPTERKKMGDAGRRAFLKNYTRSVLIGRYETLFKEVALQNRRVVKL